MKNKTDAMIAALADYCRSRMVSLQEELYALSRLAKQLELFQAPVRRAVPKEDRTDWNREVLATLEQSRTPLSKAAIAKRIEARLALNDHRMVMARVAMVLVNRQQNKIKKIKVGTSYRFIAGGQ